MPCIGADVCFDRELVAIDDLITDSNEDLDSIDPDSASPLVGEVMSLSFLTGIGLANIVGLTCTLDPVLIFCCTTFFTTFTSCLLAL